MANRIPPHSEEAEEALLGCLLIEPTMIFDLVEGFESTDFYNPKNQSVYEAIQSLQSDNKAIDFTTLTDKLKRQGTYDKVGGSEYLISLAGSAPIEHNVRDYSKIIKDNSLVRALIKTSNEIQEAAYEKVDDVENLLEDAESKIFNLANNFSEDRALVPIQNIVFQTLEKIQETNKNRGKITGIPTGLKELDEMTSGLQDSDLIIIAARPSMGKTALALNIAQHAAEKANKSVLIFSLEMSSSQLVQRMISSEAFVDSNKIRTGDLNGTEDWRPITVSAENLAKTKITISDKPGITLAELRSICRRRQLEEPIDLIVIDYMQLMSGNKRTENRQNEISEISRGLKQVAREFNCPVVCLSQLARGPEARLDKRPILSDLRDSGSIEQDADVVMFLYRDSYYNKEQASNPYEAELNIAKQRNGPTGKINLRWVAKYTKFTDPARKDMEEETPY